MARLPSAGLLLHRRTGGQVQVLLCHLGGPFWASKDAGSWSIPKGEHAADEDPLAAARREFEEELGTPAPDALYRPLGSTRQRGGKIVTAWAVAADLDVSAIISNTFEIEWPPRSGRRQAFPEIDRAAWFDLNAARSKILSGQLDFLDRLDELLS